MIEKDKDIMVYVLTHKIPEYGLPDDRYHTPIQCGADVSSCDVCDVKDNTMDNISYKNPWFLETTGIYWIWKNDKRDYVGQYQFRRRFSVNPEYIPNILNEYDIIVPKPVPLPLSIYNQYAMCHIKSDLDLCIKIIKEFYPEYSVFCDNVFNNVSFLYYSNGFITTREKYNKICEFVFSVLFEYEKRMGFKTKEEWVAHGASKLDSKNSHRGEMTDAEYQSRVGGYLFERILTLYILFNFSKRYEIQYTLMERIELMSTDPMKAINFLKK